MTRMDAHVMLTDKTDLQLPYIKPEELFLLPIIWGSISCHITPLVINSLRADTHTHTHKHTRISTFADKAILRNKALCAGHRLACT